jgi:hypothetical protein
LRIQAELLFIAGVREIEPIGVPASSGTVGFGVIIENTVIPVEHVDVPVGSGQAVAVRVVMLTQLYIINILYAATGFTIVPRGQFADRQAPVQDGRQVAGERGVSRKPIHLAEGK